MAGQPLGSPHESARELERAPHQRCSSNHGIGTLSHPVKARLRDHAEPQPLEAAYEATNERAHFAPHICARLLSAARIDGSAAALLAPRSRALARTRRAAITPLVLELSPRVDNGMQRRARCSGYVPQCGHCGH